PEGRSVGETLKALRPQPILRKEVMGLYPAGTTPGNRPGTLYGQGEDTGNDFGAFGAALSTLAEARFLSPNPLRAVPASPRETHGQGPHWMGSFKHRTRGFAAPK